MEQTRNRVVQALEKLRAVRVTVVDGTARCLDNRNSGVADCISGSPYQIFLFVSTVRQGKRSFSLISPVTATALRHNANTEFTFDQARSWIVDSSGDCVRMGGGECSKFLIEVLGDGTRLYWNTIDLYKNLGIVLPWSGNFVPPPDDGSTWLLDSRTSLVDLAFRETMIRSVVGKEDGSLAVWGGYRKRKPRAVYLIGKPGVGKSSMLGQIVRDFQLNNPVHISYDDPLPYISYARYNPSTATDEVRRYIQLWELQDVVDTSAFATQVRLSDTKVRDVIYPEAGQVEERLFADVISHKLDCIIEAGDPREDEAVEAMIQRGYSTFAVVVYLDDRTRLENEARRFQQTGKAPSRPSYPGSYREWARAREGTLFERVEVKQGYTG